MTTGAEGGRIRCASLRQGRFRPVMVLRGQRANALYDDSAIPDRIFFTFAVSWLRGSHESSRHRLFPPDRPCRGQTGKSRAEKCPEIPFAGVRRCPERFAPCAHASTASPTRPSRAASAFLRGLTSGLAAFPPGIPSLLQSGRQVRGDEDPVQARNLRSLFGVGKAPSGGCASGPGGAGPRGLRRCGPGASMPPCSAGRCSRAGRCSAGVSRSRWTGPGTVPRTGPSAGAARARTRRDGSRTSCRQAPGAATVRPGHAEAFPPAPEPINDTHLAPGRVPCESPGHADWHASGLGGDGGMVRHGLQGR